MSTPKDRERSAAFRRWVADIAGNADAAAHRLKIDRRNIPRFINGKAAPPVGLLTECATIAEAEGNDRLARRLHAAAAPATEATDA